MSSPTRRGATLALLALLTGATLSSGACYEDPQAKMDQAQQMTDLADVITDIEARAAEMASTLDSLRLIVARQDTTIYRLANLAGVPYPLR